MTKGREGEETKKGKEKREGKERTHGSGRNEDWRGHRGPDHVASHSKEFEFKPRTFLEAFTHGSDIVEFEKIIQLP